MELSICIVSWNVKELLQKCLDSIFTNPPSGEFEVIVADNNSSDSSAELLKNYTSPSPSCPEPCRRAGRGGRGVRVIENPTNLGFSAANNQCIKESKGRYILILNPDTEVLPGCLDTLIKFLEERPDAAAAAPKLLNPDRTLQRSVLGFPTLGAMIMRLLFIEQLWPGNPYTKKYLLPDFDYEKAAEIDQPMGAAILIRKSVLDKAGLFDESSFMFFDEVDLCFRIKKADWKIFFVPEAEILHRGGSSIKKWGTLNLGKHWTRSRDHYFKKHFGLKAFVLLKIFDAVRAVLITAAAVFIFWAVYALLSRR